MINTTLKLLRNHPDMNNHIAEVLIIWGANVNQKTIETYEQLVQYILNRLGHKMSTLDPTKKKF